MPRDLRNEREFSFHGCGCSLGLPVCSCVQACQKPEVEPEPPMTGDDLAIAVFICGCAGMFVAFGPMVVNFIKGVLS